MADQLRPSAFDGDEHDGERRPRHLRIDERPAVRDLDDAQLAAEALTALRAEHLAPHEPERTGILPWDSPSPPAAAAPAGSPGRHRADGRPITFSPGTRVAARGQQTASGAAAGSSVRPSPPARSPQSRVDHVVRTATSNGRAPTGPSRSAAPRWWRSRSVLMALAVVILAGAGLLAFVLVRSAGDQSPPASGPVVSVGSPGPTVDGSTPAGPTTGASAPSTATPSTATPAQASVPGGSASPATATSTSAVDSVGAAGADARPDADRTTPAPAVLSTLAPGDPGFGWPATAFGQPG